MSRLVGTCLLIAHWEFPSFHLGHWHVDCIGWSYWLRILIVILFALHWYICLKYLTFWSCWLIYLDWGFWGSYFFRASLLYLFGILTCWLHWLLILLCFVTIFFLRSLCTLVDHWALRVLRDFTIGNPLGRRGSACVEVMTTLYGSALSLRRRAKGCIPLEGMIASTRDLLKSTHINLEPPWPCSLSRRSFD